MDEIAKIAATVLGTTIKPEFAERRHFHLCYVTKYPKIRVFLHTSILIVTGGQVALNNVSTVE